MRIRVQILSMCKILCFHKCFMHSLNVSFTLWLSLWSSETLSECLSVRKLLLLITHWLFLHLNACEPSDWHHSLDYGTLEQWEESNTNAHQVLLIAKWDSSDWFTTILNENTLHNNSEYDDQDEEEVVEESMEYVVFVLS